MKDCRAYNGGKVYRNRGRRTLLSGKTKQQRHKGVGKEKGTERKGKGGSDFVNKIRCCTGNSEKIRF